MARTQSSMPPLGTPAPHFCLPDTVTGAMIHRGLFEGGSPLLVLFLSSRCPYVRHALDQIRRLGDDYGDLVGIVAFCSSDDQAHPEDAPAGLAAMARTEGLTFPLLSDRTQDVAKAFGAACTPDFFLYDERLELFYRGRLDASHPGNDVPCDANELRAAIHAALLGLTPPDEQHPSVGCNIKWRPGNEPWQLPSVFDHPHPTRPFPAAYRAPTWS